MTEMEIIIDASGEVQIRIKGAHGNECLQFSEWIEAALGRVLTREWTREYYEKEAGLNSEIQQRQ